MASPKFLPFEQVVRETLICHCGVEQREGLLVGVSGGADSVALLLAVKASGFKPVAVHCNFCLRGDESLRDETFVRTLCARHDIPLHVRQFATMELRLPGESIEMTARRLRYDYFFELLSEKSGKTEASVPKVVAVGHHQEDNVETFFLNLLRGTGLRGLSGMAWRNKQVVRPLLNTARKDIEEYLKARDEAWIDDSSNANDEYLRNRLRHHLLPVLQRFSPGALTSVAETMAHLDGSLALQREAVEQIRRKAVRPMPQGFDILPECLPEEFSQGSNALTTLLHELLAPYGFSESSVQALATLTRPGQLYEATDYLACRAARAIQVRQRLAPLPDTPLHKGTNSFDGRPSIVFELIDLPAGAIPLISFAPYKATIDADKVDGALFCRSMLPGDTFRPFGMKGHKLLSDFLTDEKVSRLERQSILVVHDNSEIVWVAGIRIAQKVDISSSTRRMAQLTLRR